MKKQNVKATKVFTAVLGAIAVGLIVAGFFVPPMGVIDGSVFIGVGEIIAIIDSFVLWESIDRGIDAKFTHKNTSIEINNPDSKNEQTTDK